MTFTTGELSYLRATHVENYNDTCVIQTFAVGSRNAYGEEVASWTDGSAISCGFQMTTGRGEFDPANIAAEAVQVDGRIRLPVGTSVTRIDRVKITHRQGQALSTPEIYDIVSPIRRGATGLYFDLRIVEL